MVNIIKKLLKDALFRTRYNIESIDLENFEFGIELQEKPLYGDFSTNLAFQIASKIKEKPVNIALAIANNINSEFIDKVEVKGGGFINIFVKPSFFHRFLKDFLENKDRIIPIIGDGLNVQVEFVSANPTGPLHIGHGRGASFGDSIYRILAAVGYKVTREYYINDRGRKG